jgi:hypothetical protein
MLMSRATILLSSNFLSTESLEKSIFLMLCLLETFETLVLFVLITMSSPPSRDFFNL